ncbi:MAG: hypothetical protein SPI36_02290 [Candidatus Onthovivens sp.]|nr:hypothetical protein [Candidatus Onthovivens sp.]
MPTIKFDEIEVGKYKVLFIGRNNAYLFKENPFIPKYHLNEASSKIIFEQVKSKLFKRTKVLNILYRDYNLEIEVKIKEYKNEYKYTVSKYEEYNYSSDSIMCKKVYLKEYNFNHSSFIKNILYNEKDLMKDYRKYSKIYFYEDVPKTKIVKKIIHRYLPENLNIGNHELIDDEDDEVRLYTPEKGFVKVRLYYKPLYSTEHQEFRIFDKEIHDKNDVKDDEKFIYRRLDNNLRRRLIILNENQNLNDKYDYEEEFFMDEDIFLIHGQEEEVIPNPPDLLVVEDDDDEIPEEDLDRYYYWEIDHFFADENFFDGQYDYLYEIDNLFNYKRINDKDNFIMLEEDDE